MVEQQYLEKMELHLKPAGFECHPFKVGWYNEHVADTFNLKYAEDTLAVLIISTPSMFDKALKPYILREDCTEGKDPVDKCVSHNVKMITEAMPEVSTEVMYDYEMDHNRRPRILVQTAGHVAGAARYYQRKDLTEDPWDDKKKIFGVSIHPQYGGWFAFRGVVIFKDVLVPDLVQPPAPDPVPENKDRVELLRRFNECWQDWSFRDIIPTVDKYSEEQKLYFITPPKDRQKVVEKMKADHECGRS